MDNQPRIIPVETEERIQGQVNAVAKLQNNKATPSRGRPTVIDDAVVVLLVAAFQNGLNTRSACQYARISKDAFYDKYKSDEDFADTIEAAKNHLVLKAGNVINKILESGADRDSGPMARWIFEKHLPDKYGARIVNNDNSKNTNVFVLTNEQLSDIAKQPDIIEGDPTELFEAVEEASQVDNGAEEESSA